MNHRKMSSNISVNSDENLVIKFNGPNETAKQKAGLKYKPEDYEKSNPKIIKVETRKIIRKKRPDYEEYLETVPQFKSKRKHLHDCIIIK